MAWEGACDEREPNHPATVSNLSDDQHHPPAPGPAAPAVRRKRLVRRSRGDGRGGRLGEVEYGLGSGLGPLLPAARLPLNVPARLNA